MNPAIIALIAQLISSKSGGGKGGGLGGFLKLGGQGQGGGDGGGEGEGGAGAAPNAFGGGGLLSDKNLLYTGGQGQPGAAQFAPQSYKGVPTFTGGTPYVPSEYEKVHAIMGLLNNLMAGAQAGFKPKLGQGGQ